MKFVVVVSLSDFEEYERDEFDEEVKNIVDYLRKLVSLTNRSLNSIIDSI